MVKIQCKRTIFASILNIKVSHSINPRNMKTVRSFFALVLLVVIFSSCDDSDCKDCEIDGDFIGERCRDSLKEIETVAGVRCK